MGRKLGILGGMGPLASAEFIRTIYELNVAEREQALPVCVLYSDPTFPDRTETLISGDHEILVGRLVEALEALLELGAHRIVIACLTIHHFLSGIPAHLRETIISLVDVTIDEIVNRGESHLLLCTNGTRASHLFEQHPRWEAASPYMRWPNDTDQQMVHDAIYKLKRGHDAATVLPFFENLRERYKVASIVAGCTELHLLTKRWNMAGNGGAAHIVDPLLIVARNLKRYLNEHQAGTKAAVTPG